MAQLRATDLPPAARLEPRGLGFSLFTSDEIKKLSVVEIQTPLIFDTIGQALPFGLHDLALGALDKSKDICSTCRGTLQLCPGHMGHIQLPLPVINPLFHNTVYQLLRHSCTSCYKIQIPGSAKHLLCTQLQLLNAGFMVEALDAENHLPNSEENDPNNVANDIIIKKKLHKYMKNVFTSDERKPSTDENCGKIVQSLKNRLLLHFANFSVPFSKCMHCKQVLSRFSFTNGRLYAIKKTLGVRNKSVVTPTEAQNMLRKLWTNECELVSLIVPVLMHSKLPHPTDLLFLDVIPVVPPRLRPVNVLHGKVAVHPQTNNYKPIIQNCITLKHLIGIMQRKDGDTGNEMQEAEAMVATTPGTTHTDKLYNLWHNLQADVDHVMDATCNKNANSDLCHGLKQVIEKKQGCIRMHMMGKRVNFAARSVITPDPNLEMEEIGIPEAFALVLTYPTPVTSWNAAELRKMIINGPKVHPGAVSVENENGFSVRLSPTDKNQRESVAKRLLTPTGESQTFLKGIKVVHRHLRNGDVLLLNRQPTLHRPGIMAHKARILKGEKTLRLNYANCKAYNADFDGDEMNAHFPQNELARSEAYTLVNVCNNYLVPKDGTPLSGLIQDHIVSGVRMTLRGRFFNRDDYSQLVYQALLTTSGKIQLLPPAIMKPCKLWSGKQIISTVILNVIPKGRAPINLQATAKIGCKAWQNAEPRAWKAGGTLLANDMDMSESEVVIRQGELLSGVLDKTHYGATPFGLVHCLYELYGGQCSSKLLSAFSKLFTAFLQMEGFTLGVEDILVVDNAEESRNKSVEESRAIGDETAAHAFDLVQPTPQQLREKLEQSLSTSKAKWRTVIDRSYKTALDGYTNVINKACLPAGLLKKFPDNNLQLMVQSGAKGSTVNTMQISCLLGQIELEGKRPPLMISGKSLPSFPKYDTSPRAGGFIDGRFLTGIQPQEFFFHCMAGREGLIDTAVKTSRSGYLQRCLIKHLEGLTVNYDQTVRDSDGSVVQFYYGEDGLDVTKAQFLTPTQMPFLSDNAQAVIVKSKLLDDSSVIEGIASQRHKVQDWNERKRLNSHAGRERNSPFSQFSAVKRSSLPPELFSDYIGRTGRAKASAVLSEMWRSAKPKHKVRYLEDGSRCPDTVMSLYQADRDFGTLTERMESLMDNYLTPKLSKISSENAIAADEFRMIMSHKSMKSLCPAGEPVGLLAAQSIGEPSTQMTLNTFHFAGRGEMNVTLGIPRLREILMVASKTIKTPSMDIPFHQNLLNLPQKADHLKKEVARVTLSDVLESVTINFHLEYDLNSRRQVYKIRLDFLPESVYKAFCSVTPDIILEYIERKFLKLLIPKIANKFKKNAVLRIESEESDTKTANEENDDEEPGEKKRGGAKKGNMVEEEHMSSDEDDEGDDEDATMARSRARHSEREYEDPEAIEEDVEIDESEVEDFDEPVPREPEEVDEDESFYDDGEKSGLRSSKDIRCQDMINSDQHVLGYDYGSSKGRTWCCIEIGISLDMKRVDLSTRIREIADSCILWEVPNIRRGFTYTNNDTHHLVFKTDGINISEMFKYYKLLDLNKLYTNDIHGMAATYGIEAARRVIVHEVQDVFKMYGITVDARHLLLIADYMTYNGVFEPLNRTGMEKNVSPLQQMSFESSLKFLRLAAISGKKDDLFSPSSRLMIGRPCKSGTGMFQVFQTFQSQDRTMKYKQEHKVW